MLSMVCQPLLAQEEEQPPRKQLVVADVETLQPVAGANVQGRSRVSVTDSAGRFTLPDDAPTLVVSHVNYESRIVNTAELSSDTLWVISKLLNVKEVVVFGQKPTTDDGLADLRHQLRAGRVEAQLAAADPNMNLYGLLKMLIPKKWRKSAKKSHRERLQEALENY